MEVSLVHIQVCPKCGVTIIPQWPSPASNHMQLWKVSQPSKVTSQGVQKVRKSVTAPSSHGRSDSNSRKHLGREIMDVDDTTEVFLGQWLGTEN